MAVWSPGDDPRLIEKAVAPIDTIYGLGISTISGIIDAAIKASTSHRNNAALSAAIVRRDIDGIYRSSGASKFVDELGKVSAEIVSIYADGGAAMAKRVRGGKSFAFDITRDQAVNQMRSLRFEFVTRMAGEQRKAIASALAIASRAHFSQAETVVLMAGVVGLNERQAVALANFRKGKGQGAANVNSVKDYRERLLATRRDAIASTETVKAAALGEHAALSQAIEDGVVDGRLVRRYWIVSRDEKTCPICNAIARSHKLGVLANQPFQSENGPIMTPPAHVNCRCEVLTRIASSGFTDLVSRLK